MRKPKPWKPRAGESELLDQVRRAGEQLEAAPGGPLGWLVAFVAQDPKAWLPGEGEAHGFRLLALVHRNRIPPNLVGGTNIYPLKPREVVALHGELRAFLMKAVTAPGRPAAVMISVPTEGLESCLVRATAPGVKPAIFSYSRGGPFRTMLFQEVAALIVASDRLLACPGPRCGQPFLALRKRVFCSDKCAQQFHDARKIEARRRGNAF